MELVSQSVIQSMHLFISVQYLYQQMHSNLLQLFTCVFNLRHVLATHLAIFREIEYSPILKKNYTVFKLCYGLNFFIIFYCILYYYLHEDGHMGGRNMFGTLCVYVCIYIYVYTDH